ncbi:unnamed protein product [Thlaspi arvense]|uniref:Uncharacterized protein n=1 Tax=Thlaspi arvense TaxID=13288 RepID=A0AAU9SQH3_THLAR|nr:unnamed protein product [Thlaspi arvense]
MQMSISLSPYPVDRSLPGHYIVGKDDLLRVPIQLSDPLWDIYSRRTTKLRSCVSDASDIPNNLIPRLESVAVFEMPSLRYPFPCSHHQSLCGFVDQKLFRSPFSTSLLYQATQTEPAWKKRSQISLRQHALFQVSECGRKASGLNPSLKQHTVKVWMFGFGSNHRLSSMVHCKERETAEGPKVSPKGQTWIAAGFLQMIMIRPSSSDRRGTIGWEQLSEEEAAASNYGLCGLTLCNENKREEATGNPQGLQQIHRFASQTQLHAGVPWSKETPVIWAQICIDSSGGAAGE